MSSHFEVQTRFALGPWRNCWTINDEPQTFATQDEAALELKEFADDMRSAGMSFNSEDYRIVEVYE